MAAASSPFISLIFLLFLAVAAELKPSPQRDNKQVLHSLFGSRLSTLILATPTFDDITEGSAGQLTKASTTPSAVLPVSHALAKRVDSRTEAVPQFFLNFLRRQTKMRRWSRKSMMGGRGCFGMKMDRIGSMSGLGC
ncbi:C-type natriuretic peptide 2 [Neolamprologus brichardi]|uniref:C-type natriuretic peptide 2-like n=1 Tax=Neolamprologus brichardi TaxID=32507 RepID=A0A3Q4I232_NEOBR|nr:C-type natriuretic peptide 2 [Neolamprologus brichardi]